MRVNMTCLRMLHVVCDEAVHCFYAKLVVDLSCLCSKYAWLCLKLRIGYCGMAFTEWHVQLLELDLFQKMKGAMLDASTRWYNPHFASAMKQELTPPVPPPGTMAVAPADVVAAKKAAAAAAKAAAAVAKAASVLAAKAPGAAVAKAAAKAPGAAKPPKAKADTANAAAKAAAAKNKTKAKAAAASPAAKKHKTDKGDDDDDAAGTDGGDGEIDGEMWDPLEDSEEEDEEPTPVASTADAGEWE